MAHSGLEPFPPLTSTQQHARSQDQKNRSHDLRRRRKSSGLGGELPGDNSAAAFATVSPPQTPPAHSRHNSEKPHRRSKRRTVKRALSKWKRISLRHTWLNPLIICLICVSLYLINPSPSNPISAGLFLSYPLPREPGSNAPIQYGKGARDFAFVGFYTIFFTFTREFIMQRLLKPIALRYGIRSRAKQARFMEQFYTAIYFSILGPYGLYVMSRTPIWYFNTTAMYEGFPHKTHEALFKAYYLLQASYWTQQMVVLILLLEKPRKDFKEFVAHHLITMSLIWCSYRFHFTYMGLAVYITHDISDFFLATSKVLNYIDSPLVGPFFFSFMAIWGYLRHYLNLKILYSILTEFKTVGPYELNWETQQYKCWIAQYITFSLLAALQAVNAFWSFYILRIAYRFVASWGDDVRDDRSDDEGSADEGAESEKKEKKSVGTPKEKQANGVAKANGDVTGSLNGTPKVMLNGEPVPRTPSPAATAATGTPDTIGSRLKERRRNQK